MTDPKTQDDENRAGQKSADSLVVRIAEELTTGKSGNATDGAKAEQQPASRLKIFQANIWARVAGYWESLKGKGKANRIIVVATIVIAGASVLTWREAHNAGEQTDGIISADQRTVSAIEGAVQQANVAFNATAEQFRLDQRAWVGIVKVNSFSFRAGPKFSIPFDMVNTGKSPARNVATKTALKTLENNAQFVPTYPDPKPIKPSIGVVQPQMHMELFTLPVDISITQYGDIENGRGILYAYGDITYDDIFGRPHETTFCVMYWAGLAGPILCDTYNDAK